MTCSSKRSNPATPHDQPPLPKHSRPESEDLERPSIRPEYLQPTFQSNFHTALKQGTSFKDELTGASHAPDPFPHAQLPQLLPATFIDRLCKDIETTLTFTPRSNDLYRFRQSSDLANLPSHGSAVSVLRDTLYSEEFVQLMSSLTGLDLDATADLSSHQYGPGDYLLCHDDDIRAQKGARGRRVAFILYLVPETWSESDGGSLDLYTSDAQGLPDQVTKRLFPLRGSLAFFPISPGSHHEVAQVSQACRHTRLSVSGWFHGALPASQPLNPTIHLPWTWKELELLVDEDILTQWINKDYLKETAQKIIGEKFLEESSLSLQSFLSSRIRHEWDEGDALKEALIHQVKWENQGKGPANVRRHAQAYLSDLAEGNKNLLKNLMHFFHSLPCRQYLASLTGLELGRVHSKLVSYSPGDYSLLRDDVQEPIGLDVVCWLGCASTDHLSAPEDWSEGWDGQMVYVGEAKGDEEEEEATFAGELISLWPSISPGDVALTYRDVGVRRFIKRVQGPWTWYALSIVYETLWSEGEEEEDEEE
ncbi:MAG: Oxoglutarate and iron-dependent oxygenase degradation C-term-domain-containing protein [Piptocephalis tieghemiana]|nr:MAG: Oxoglutarate and iron-dependent oxygenase degradation C-term-domain-containing protein [Piptocephalis tieghemiana]